MNRVNRSLTLYSVNLGHAVLIEYWGGIRSIGVFGVFRASWGYSKSVPNTLLLGLRTLLFDVLAGGCHLVCIVRSCTY